MIDSAFAKITIIETMAPKSILPNFHIERGYICYQIWALKKDQISLY